MLSEVKIGLIDFAEGFLHPLLLEKPLIPQHYVGGCQQIISIASAISSFGCYALLDGPSKECKTANPFPQNRLTAFVSFRRHPFFYEVPDVLLEVLVQSLRIGNKITSVCSLCNGQARARSRAFRPNS